MSLVPPSGAIRFAWPILISCRVWLAWWNFWINTNTSINITQNWKLNYNARFNARDKSIIRHNVTLYREIDCWEFFVDWTPNGYAKGLYFRLNLKSDILKDLKVERRQGLYSNRSNF